MTYETLSETDLQTEGERRLLRYFKHELLRIEHRLAMGNKLAAQSYLKPHEMEAFEARAKA